MLFEKILKLSFFFDLKKYQETNTIKQNEQALRNFDLTDYRTIFADLVVHLYDEILKRIKAKLIPMIIPAIIEHEDLDSGGIPSINPTTSTSNDKRSKFSAQDLLKQVKILSLEMSFVDYLI